MNTSTVWKVIVGIGVVIAVISGVMSLQSKFITCDKFETAFAGSIDLMRQMQIQQDMRDYDFATESIQRDVEIECEKPNSDLIKCQKYREDLKNFKGKRDAIRDEWKVKGGR